MRTKQPVSLYIDTEICELVDELSCAQDRAKSRIFNEALRRGFKRHLVNKAKRLEATTNE
ncbi:hypothetical protein [Gloeocapsopsis crepidinum]|uniref:hypothetical protein n=1 Tax=Gloeocapsopsis crepidinum TaxID=693223 RepID=UPI0018830A27|nr:hypothetical protein [Gloeocapsopsis crepidinum]